MAQAAKETKTAKESTTEPTTEPKTEREPAPPVDEDAAPAGGTHVCDVAFCPIGSSASRNRSSCRCDTRKASGSRGLTSRLSPGSRFRS